MTEIRGYGKHTLEDLEVRLLSMNRAEDPDNYQEIEKEIARKRKKLLAVLYKGARAALEDEGDPLLAGKLFRRVVNEYPGTLEAQYADGFLGEIRGEKEEGERQELGLAFHGSAQEYFRIWIVNLCLTLVTLGIFSAWAKVRKKRYFYSHLTLDGTAFQYLGLPVPILKGRIIAVAIFLLYYLSSNVFITLLPYVMAAGLALAPWIVIQSSAFKARYSAYRNMTFRFSGTYLQSLKTVSAWGIAPAIVVGTIFNWGGELWIAGILFALFGLMFPWWFRNIKHFVVTNTSFGGQNAQFGATGGQFYGIYFTSGFILLGFSLISIVIATTGVAKAAPWGVYVTMMPGYAGYVVAFAYIQANMTNTVWNRMRIGPVSFECTLGAGDMAKLYLTNAIAIILSAGMLIPWAVVRTYRYRVEHTRVFRSSDLSEFRGTPGETVRAAGAELSEIFDMELAI